MNDFKHVPIKRQYTKRQLFYDVLGSLNSVMQELNLALMNAEDYELNDARIGGVVKNDVKRVMCVVSDEREAIKHQIDILEADE